MGEHESLRDLIGVTLLVAGVITLLQGIFFQKTVQLGETVLSFMRTLPNASQLNLQIRLYEKMVRHPRARLFVFAQGVVLLVVGAVLLR